MTPFWGTRLAITSSFKALLHWRKCLLTPRLFVHFGLMLCFLQTEDTMYAPIALLAAVWPALAAAVNLNVTALVAETIESDWTTTYYSKDSPLLLGNDGGASTGGFHAWDINGDEPLEASVSLFTGRTKLLSTLYNVGGKDYLVSIPQTTSRLTLYELPDVTKVDEVEYFALGDWSALCSWKSRSKNDYLFLFGKREAIQFLVRSGEERPIEILRVCEAAMCHRNSVC